MQWGIIVISHCKTLEPDKINLLVLTNGNSGR